MSVKENIISEINSTFFSKIWKLLNFKTHITGVIVFVEESETFVIEAEHSRHHFLHFSAKVGVTK